MGGYRSPMVYLEEEAMKAMISKRKMSKKAQKEPARQQRKTWTMKPVTRIKGSGKIYSRKRKRDNESADCMD